MPAVVRSLTRSLPSAFDALARDPPNPRVASGLTASSRALLPRWSKTGCKAGLRFCRSRAGLKMRSGPEPVKLQFDRVGRFRPITGRAKFARVRGQLLALKTPQVPIYSLELCRFEGSRNGATPH